MRLGVAWIFAAALLAGGLLRAEDRPPAPVADLLKLAEAGLGDEVQIAWIEAQPPFAPVGADAIVKLKDARIAEKTLEVFVRNGSDATAQRKRDAARGGEVVFVKTYEVMSLATLSARARITPADYEQADRSDGVHVTESVVRYTFDSSMLNPPAVYGTPTISTAVPASYVFPYSWYRTQPTYYRGPYYPYYRPAGYAPCGYPSYAHGGYRVGGTGFNAGCRR
ncbi:MAG: hypothetical protein KIS92_11940 [Planctomycetota bacterium]|nr:hypothetical protein [Planctomycetota bacterium]